MASHETYSDHVGRSAVCWIGPAGFDERRLTRLPTAGPHGMVSPGPGNAMDRGPEEYYLSEPRQLPEGAAVTGIAWEAELGPRIWVRAQVRFGATPGNPARALWSVWLACGAATASRDGAGQSL